MPLQIVNESLRGFPDRAGTPRTRPFRLAKSCPLDLPGRRPPLRRPEPDVLELGHRPEDPPGSAPLDSDRSELRCDRRKAPVQLAAELPANPDPQATGISKDRRPNLLLPLRPADDGQDRPHA